MTRIPDSELKAVLSAEKADALAAVSASKLSSERENAHKYYMGDVSNDMPSVSGRSTAVSTDVSDTIEGLMPSLMEIFTGGDEVVRFEPVGEEDVQAAEQETDYVNHVFMHQNPGFMVLYSFIKDALLSKVGIVKVYWDESEKEERETYYDQSGDTFNLLAGDPEVEVVAHTEHDGLHDVTVARRKTYSCAKVDPVPPEEFGIARRARSVADANYCFHEVVRTESDLIAEGFDEDQVKKLSTYGRAENTESTARDTVDESSEKEGDEGLNKAMRPIRVTEHYIRMDYERDGAPRLYRVTTGGEQGEVLKRDGKPDVIEEDFMPFAAITPVAVTHRFFGRSVADLVMDIQRIKTALLRSLLDNAYLANNPRTEIAESHASEATLDDLLISRPGGIVRTKIPGGLSILQHPDIGSHVFPLLQYQDATREWRTGVTRQGQGLDADALQNQTATATNQLYSAAQARMKLIARILAETGIKDFFCLLHAVIRKNGKEVQTVRLRNTWVPVDPRTWKTRNDMTINVGLGSGGKQERLQGLMLLLNMQKEALMGGMTNLVSAQNIYNSGKELIKLLDLKTVDPYFTDPATSQAPPPVNPKVEEMKAKAEIEKLQAEADIATNNKKVEAEIALAREKFALEAELKRMESQDRREAHKQTMAQTYAKGLAKPKDAEGKPQANPDAEPLLRELRKALKKVNAPKRVLLDERGEVAGVEHVDLPDDEQEPDMGGLLESLFAELQKANAPKRVVRDEAGIRLE